MKVLQIDAFNAIVIAAAVVEILIHNALDAQILMHNLMQVLGRVSVKIGIIILEVILMFNAQTVFHTVIFVMMGLHAISVLQDMLYIKMELAVCYHATLVTS